MRPKLTILVPNYNRPQALSRLLRSVFKSIDIANASDLVRVLVIDDFSTEPLDEALAPSSDRPNFSFTLQSEKRGNAEAAFLGSLQIIETEYTWLLGNDDQVVSRSVSAILQIIRHREFGLVLLNPLIAMGDGVLSLPLSATTPTVRYTNCADLFSDWGFVTSTTTFPCIVFKTAPVARFHLRHHLERVAQVYSHSFTLFSALYEAAGLYVAEPLVEFNLNFRSEEQEKLQRQSPGYMHAYHQSVGLGRLIHASSKHSGKSIAEIGNSIEDELDKERNRIGQTTLSHFVTFFLLDQIIWEHENMIDDSSPARHLSREEIAELFETVCAFGNPFLLNNLAAALAIHRSGTLSAKSKVVSVSLLQADILTDARRSLKERIWIDPLGPRKIALSGQTVTGLRGSAGDIHGRPL